MSQPNNPAWSRDDLVAMRNHLFGSPATEPESDDGTAQPSGNTVAREGSNPTPLPGGDNARFAASLFNQGDEFDGYEEDPPAPWTPRILDSY